jgi:hypothetical protein
MLARVLALGIAFIFIGASEPAAFAQSDTGRSQRPRGQIDAQPCTPNLWEVQG